jgi:hypothetical protein
MRAMKLRLLGSVIGLAVAAASSSVACSEETIIRVQAAPDGGDPEGGAPEAAAPACTPGASVDCTCPTGATGKADCDDTGSPGLCKCVTTDLGSHTVISKGTKGGLEVETHLAAAPDGALASVWISLGAAGTSDIGYVFSRDGGATWTTPKATGDASGRESSDPVVASDAQGNFYVTWIAFDRGGGQPSNFVLYVAKAKAGQDTFGTPVAVDTFDSGDKPWITVTAAGTILVTCMQRAGSESVLNAHRSTNGGTTWTKSPIFTSVGGNQANFIVPCAPKTGTRIWASHLSVEGAGLVQRLHWSDDDGVTWPLANTKTYGINSSITPATCVAKGSDVWIGYGQWTSQPADAEAPVDEYHVIHTTNGTTITDVIASDAKTKQQNLGSLALDDATGELALTYYAGDSDGATGNVRSVRSTDGGKTWGASKSVSADLQFTADRASAKWLGDYIGTVLRGGSLYVSYGENADTVTHVAFSKTP